MFDPAELYEKAQSLPVGKRISNTIYIHRGVLEDLLALPSELTYLVKTRLSEWNCLKISISNKTISFLQYEDFEESDHPILSKALTVHPGKGTSRLVQYREDRNPPILHRKELLVGPSHPRFEEWAAQTRREEELGLYDNPSTIGFLDNWNELLAEKGLCVKEKEQDTKPLVERHRTAISRARLSKPVQALLSSGFLSEDRSFFDYGCGKGDDISFLTSTGFDAKGWDPAYRPDAPKTEADIVNLGFVLNVIENSSERIRVLQEAFSLTRSVLCVGVLVENMQTAVNLKPYKDGYLTSRNTFQKFYSQYEIAQLLEDSLQKPIAAIGPGLFFVFKKDEEAENFFLNRSHREYAWKEWGIIRRWTADDRVKFKRDQFFKDNEHLIECFWNKTLELGRFPGEEEFENLGHLVEKAGAHRRLKAWIAEHYGIEPFEKALQRKREDLIVFLALRHFQKRLPLKKLPLTVQRDIQACFPNYEMAWETARSYLFQIGNPEVVTRKCNESPTGRLDEQALYVTPDEVPMLDPVLRIYIQTGEFFYGDRFSSDEIKIHKASGKVSFLSYDEPKYLRKTHYRTKVNLRNQKVIFYDHSL